jgi:putative Holliday junction resolvase
MANYEQALPGQGRLLAIDAGERRVGVAVCDELQTLATPLAVMSRRSRAEDFGRLARLAQEQQVVGLVVGHPLDADGTAGPQAQKAARYGHRLAGALSLPVQLWDEHGSSQEAARRLVEAGKRRQGEPLDAEAAAVILQDYLDTRRRERAAAASQNAAQ